MFTLWRCHLFGFLMTTIFEAIYNFQFSFLFYQKSWQLYVWNTIWSVFVAWFFRYFLTSEEYKFKRALEVVRIQGYCFQASLTVKKVSIGPLPPFPPHAFAYRDCWITAPTPMRVPMLMMLYRQLCSENTNGRCLTKLVSHLKKVSS